MIVPFKATPAARYVHPRAVDIEEQEDEHDLNLDIASDAAPNYLRWVADLCAPHLGESVLEVGAGIGAVTQHLVHGRRVVATDLSQSCVDAMRQRFEGLSNVQVLQADLRSWDPGEIFDSVLLVNVLEHIRDDVRALSSLRRFVRSGGSIVIYVPALNGLFGPWDRRAGHFRRYSKWRLRAVMREASLQPEELRYANLMAIPAWILFSSVSKVDSEGESSLSIWDRTAVPLTQFLETRIRVPIGLNLLGVGRVE